MSNSLWEVIQVVNFLVAQVEALTHPTSPACQTNQPFLPPPPDVPIPSSHQRRALPSQLRQFAKFTGAVEDKLVGLSINKDELVGLDSEVFNSKGQCIGQVNDVFGKVQQPFYSILAFPTVQVGPGQTFYCSNRGRILAREEIQSLKSRRGTDASWRDDAEKEYSSSSDDDEQAVRNRNHNKEKKGGRKRVFTERIKSLLESLPKELQGQDIQKLTLKELMELEHAQDML